MAIEAGYARVPRITALGGGHGLFATLRAARQVADEVTAVVTVADNGGSSGRIRAELGLLPPGDLRMALAALAADDENGRLWARTLQHRFGGDGALAGHSAGNLLITALVETLGDPVAALGEVARLLGVRGRVLPMVAGPLDIEADVLGLEEDPRLVRTVRGQVAVATTMGTVRRVRLTPEGPPACPDAVAAVLDADAVVLGPGSWFSSVIPHVLVPGLLDALCVTGARKVLALNLEPQPGETAGFTAERHLHVLAHHAPQLRVDDVLVDEGTPLSATEREHLRRAAGRMGAEVRFAPLAWEDPAGVRTARHDWDLFAEALGALVLPDGWRPTGGDVGVEGPATGFDERGALGGADG